IEGAEIVFRPWELCLRLIQPPRDRRPRGLLRTDKGRHGRRTRRSTTRGRRRTDVRHVGGQYTVVVGELGGHLCSTPRIGERVEELLPGRQRGPGGRRVVVERV